MKGSCSFLGKEGVGKWVEKDVEEKSWMEKGEEMVGEIREDRLLGEELGVGGVVEEGE